MHIVYYAWVLQNISELIRIFFPKEIVVIIVSFMRSTIIKHNDLIDMEHITIIPMRSNISDLYYDTDHLLIKTNAICLREWNKIRYSSDDNPKYISFILDLQTTCVNLKNFMIQIDNLMQLDKMRKQLFGEKWDTFTYCSCLSSDPLVGKPRDRIKMMLHKKPKLIFIIDKKGTNIPIPISNTIDIKKIIRHGSVIKFIYSLKIFFTPSTYGICPVIKLLRR